MHHLPHHTESDRVIVTGATGFLGRRVAERLARAGRCVLATGRRPTRDIAAIPENRLWSYTRADLTQSSQCAGLVRGATQVVHCAGLAHQFHGDAKPSDFHRVNCCATQNLLRASAAAGVRHVVLVSSSSVYGSGQVDASESATPSPDTPYGRSKLDAERVAHELCDQYEIALTVLRPATIYGVGDPGNLRRLIRALITRRFVWVGDGSNRKSLVCVNDVARVIQCVLEETATSAGQTLNVAPAALTMRSVVESITRAAGLRPPRLAAPGGWVEGSLRVAAALGHPRLERAHSMVKKWLSDDTIDGTQLTRLFPANDWTPSERGLAEETRWLIDEQLSKRQAA